MTEPQTKPARRAKAPAGAPRQKRAARRQACSAPSIEAGALTANVAPGLSSPAKGPSGKLGIVVALMRRPEGATVAQMSEATGWLPHSVRGALSGAIKKKHKLEVVSEPADGGRIYRLPVENAA